MNQHGTVITAGSAPENGSRSPSQRIRDEAASDDAKAGNHAGNHMSALAHDTRNWLTVLQIYSDLLRTSGAVEAGHQSWMDELSEAITRGHVLVGALLACAQTGNSGTIAIEMAPSYPRKVQKRSREETADEWNTASSDSGIDLTRALERRLPMLRRLAGPQIRVTADIDAAAGTVALPEDDFDRILNNLVINAVEAMPKGGELHIELATQYIAQAGPISPDKEFNPQTAGMEPDRDSNPANRRALLRISDTGTGISHALLPHIFQRGVSGKTDLEDYPRSSLFAARNEQQAQERGLGLATVRDLVLRAGGTAGVLTRPGRGTCFEIAFSVIGNCELVQKTLSNIAATDCQRSQTPRTLRTRPVPKQTIRENSSRRKILTDRQSAQDCCRRQDSGNKQTGTRKVMRTRPMLNRFGN